MKNEFLSGTNQGFNEEVFNDSTHAWSVCFMFISSIISEILSAQVGINYTSLYNLWQWIDKVVKIKSRVCDRVWRKKKENKGDWMIK